MERQELASLPGWICFLGGMRVWKAFLAEETAFTKVLSLTRAREFGELKAPSGGQDCSYLAEDG